MSIPMTAANVLDREFLEMRAKVLELAASLDRMARAAGDVGEDSRLRKLKQAMQVVVSEDREDRAEQVQQIFSREYDPNWRQDFQLS